MEVPVLIEHITGNGYRAKSGGPLELTAEGTTRDEAVVKLREMLRRPPAEAELSVVTLPSEPELNPWEAMAGIFDPNDPDVQEWLEIMAENRHKADEDPDYR